MRQFVRRRAVEHGLDSVAAFEAQLVATEAVTNAIRHGTQAGLSDPISVSCRHKDAGLSIEVGDRGRFRRAAQAPELAESGRGLGLIERFTREFQLETSESGTRLRMLVGQAA
jgi:anti-sigma regulatory factor (Ser/Thr protein kinase)